MTPFFKYLEYLESLASSHAEVKHHPKNKRRFVGWVEQEFKALAQSGTDIIVQADAVNGKLASGSHFDDMRPEFMTGFMIWVKKGDGTDHDREREAFEKSWKIGREFLARIVEDSRTDNCPELMFFDVDRVSFNMVSTELGNYSGYIFNFPMRDSGNSIEYDETVWQ